MRVLKFAQSIVYQHQSNASTCDVYRSRASRAVTYGEVFRLDFEHIEQRRVVDGVLQRAVDDDLIRMEGEVIEQQTAAVVVVVTVAVVVLFGEDRVRHVARVQHGKLQGEGGNRRMSLHLSPRVRARVCAYRSTVYAHAELTRGDLFLASGSCNCSAIIFLSLAFSFLFSLLSSLLLSSACTDAVDEHAVDFCCVDALAARCAFSLARSILRVSNFARTTK